VCKLAPRFGGTAQSATCLHAAANAYAHLAPGSSGDPYPNCCASPNGYTDEHGDAYRNVDANADTDDDGDGIADLFANTYSYADGNACCQVHTHQDRDPVPDGWR
jgi:hypothetical protein